MTYFRHTELVNRYHVSLKTVHNWIDAAKQGKLDLKLVENGSRTYVANNPGNVLILEKLAEEGKKYRNVRFNKVVTPKPEFYEVYSRRQILDIINNLMVHREIPLQYSYMDEGAHNWDEWIRHLASEDAPNSINNSLELLKLNAGVFDQLVFDYERVNVIDVGVGNAYPIRDLLAHLQDQGVLHRYVALDISEEMVDIARKNVTDWFGDTVNFEGYVRDICIGRFDDLLVDDMLSAKADKTINIVLLLGGTLSNFRSASDVVRNIYNSLGVRDVIVQGSKIDAESLRKHFDRHPDERVNELPLVPRFAISLLNIDREYYDVEMGYDEDERMRFVRIRFKTAVTLHFKFEDIKRSINFERGETLLLGRIRQMTSTEVITEYEDQGFNLLQSSKTKNRDGMLAIFSVGH